MFGNIIAPFEVTIADYNFKASKNSNKISYYKEIRLKLFKRLKKLD